MTYRKLLISLHIIFFHKGSHIHTENEEIQGQSCIIYCITKTTTWRVCDIRRVGNHAIEFIINGMFTDDGARKWRRIVGEIDYAGQERLTVFMKPTWLSSHLRHIRKTPSHSCLIHSNIRKQLIEKMLTIVSGDNKIIDPWTISSPRNIRGRFGAINLQTSDCGTCFNRRAFIRLRFGQLDHTIWIIKKIIDDDVRWEQWNTYPLWCNKTYEKLLDDFRKWSNDCVGS